MPRIGEILVEMRACGPARVREALERQVLFGGRLGTNLLDIPGALTEEALARALERQHGMRALSGDLRPQREALALLRPELADRLEIVPYQLAARRLSVLCCDPRELAKLDEVAFATGKVVEPIVVPEARLWVLLRAHYGVERQLRGIEVDGLRAERAAPPDPVHADAAAEGVDLMDEAEFHRLYSDRVVPQADPSSSPAWPPRAPSPATAAAQPPPPAAPRGPAATSTATGAPAAAWPPLPRPGSSPSRLPAKLPSTAPATSGAPAGQPSHPRDLTSTAPAPAEPSRSRASSTAPAPPEPSQSLAPAPDRDEPRSGVRRDETRSGVRRGERGQTSTPTSTRARPPPAPPPRAPPAQPRRPAAEPADPFAGALVTSEQVLAQLQAEAREAQREAGRAIPLREPHAEPAAPLSFGEAVAELAGVGERGAIARIVLRYARSRFRRAVLLTVHGRRADGWEGLGDGLTPHSVARIHVPLDAPGVVRTVVDSRSHFLGPLARTEANIRLLRALAGGAPKNAFAMPILARGQVVNVLYADAGRGGLVDAEGVGELLILASKIAQSYDALLARAR